MSQTSALRSTRLTREPLVGHNSVDKHPGMLVGLKSRMFLVASGMPTVVVGEEH